MEEWKALPQHSGLVFQWLLAEGVEDTPAADKETQLWLVGPQWKSLPHTS